MNNTPDTTKRIFNPDTQDFTTTYDINENGQPVTFTIHAREIASFPPVIADHLAKHLAKQLVGKRGTVRSNYELEYAKALKEIEVQL